MRVWPTMLLLGVVVALVFGIQMDLLPQQKERLVGGLMWLAIFFAGMTAVDRSFAAEREDDCWDSLRSFPIDLAAIYWAKLIANALSLGAVQLLLIPLFLCLSGSSLWDHPLELLVVAVLGNVGLAAVGTLVSALAASIGRSGNLLVPLVLPLAVPVLLAAAEATRLLADDRVDEVWWRWIQLLAAFAVVFVTSGTFLFQFAVED